MRKEKSIKNFLTTFFPFIAIAILGFIKTKFFVNYLGDELVALDQLFYQILAYISLAEGGIGLFIVQKYYQYLASNDHNKINELYSASKKLLTKIGFLMIIIGVGVSFFIKLLTNNNLSFLYIEIVFIVFLIKNVMDYFLFTPRFILQADQKLYKVNLLINFIRISELIIEIILVYIGIDYLIILIPGIILKYLFNIIINKKVYKEYSWLKYDKNVSLSSLKGIKHLFSQKIAGTIYSNVDIILISTKMKPLYVVMYSSYNYIIKSLYDVIYMIGAAFSPSYGNVLTSENKTTQYQVFKEISSFFYFMATFCTVMFYILANSFITLWIGDKYIISTFTLILFASLLYLNITQKTILITKDNYGLFKETKKSILLEAIFNLILSLIFLTLWKMNGVLLATLIATIGTTLWYIPKYVYTNKFNKNWLLYFKDYFINIVITIIFIFVFNQISLFNPNNFIFWLINAIIYSIILLVILFIIFYLFNKDFQSIILKLLMERKNKKGAKIQ